MWTQLRCVGEADNPGLSSLSPGLRALSWNMSSLTLRQLVLRQLLANHHIDMAFIQEHRVPIEARARMRRDFRIEGWNLCFGPDRQCGYGEAIVVHKRFSGVALRESASICAVALRLRNGAWGRFASSCGTLAGSSLPPGPTFRESGVQGRLQH